MMVMVEAGEVEFNFTGKPVRHPDFVFIICRLLELRFFSCNGSRSILLARNCLAAAVCVAAAAAAAAAA